MSKTIALRTELQRLFETLTVNVHFEEAPGSSPYPYLVFELSELTYSDGKTTYQLEVNILDRGDSTRVVEILADNVQTALNKYFFINAEIQFTAYKGLRQTVREDDKKIRRRRLLFEIQLHEMKEE